MSKKILASVAAAALLTIAGAGAAQADDSPLAGGYAGVQGGYDIYSIGANAKGIEGGVYVGYNSQVADKFILGGEGNFNLTDAKSASVDARAKSDYGLSLRAGFLVTDSAMLYARGGWAWSRIDSVGIGKTFSGWTLGGGIETMITDNISARAEFVYTKYNSGLGLDPKQKDMNIGIAYHF